MDSFLLGAWLVLARSDRQSGIDVAASALLTHCNIGLAGAELKG